MNDKRIVTAQGNTDCPHCGQPNNAHAGAGVPQTGDWSCCYGCRKISRFVVPPDGTLSLRKATPSDLVEFVRDDPELAKMLATADEDVAAAVAEDERRDRL